MKCLSVVAILGTGESIIYTRIGEVVTRSRPYGGAFKTTLETSLEFAP